jgi:non-canonical (house-cleaning) NTP pyrophosphatase
VIPYFAPGLHRSSTEENSLSTAKSYAKIISNCLVPTQDGPPRIHIYDISSNDIESWFSDSAIVNLDTAVSLIKDKITKETTIVFPDQTIQNKYLEYFSEFRIYNVSTKTTINWPSPGYDDGCLDNVLIIDDWVQTGDTLEKCRLEMVTKGAKVISAYVTHAVFPNGSYKNTTFEKFNKIYVTNSIPEVTQKIKNKHPFEVLKLDGLIRDKLLHLFDIEPSDIILPKQYNVYVASENSIKLSATYDAINKVLKECEKDNYNLKVFGVDVPSDVPNQPINEETILGCKNRLNNLIKYVESKQLDCDFFVSIESGVYFDGELCLSTQVRDHCYTIIVAKSDVHTATCQKMSTQFTVFPAHFVIESIRTNREQTVGNLIEKAYGYKSNTWHEHFGNKITRHQMIFNTIVESFGSAHLG